MRKRTIVRIIGVLNIGLGAAMLLCALMAHLYREEDLFALLAAGVVTLLVGSVAAVLPGRIERPIAITHRGAFAIVALGWLSACLLGALPYYFYAHLPWVWHADAPARIADAQVPAELVSPADCQQRTGLGAAFCAYTNSAFESASGFTTTGATILEAGLWHDPASRKGGLPHALLFWRALTQFLGGMGIILLGVTILPLLGVGGMQLFKAEVPGPVKDKMAPRVADTAVILWAMYAIFTAVQIALLWVAGVRPYLAVSHALTTMATGGFSPLAHSMAALHSPVIEWITIAFMFLGGARFSLHYKLWHQRTLAHWRDSEFRFYTGIILIMGVLLAAVLFARQGFSVHDSVRGGLFQVVSILTTTGYASSDFAAWAPGAQLLLFVLFFIGGCAGSTSGGIKVVRIYLMLRLAGRELRRLLHPHAVIQTRLSGSVVPTDVTSAVAGFVLLYLAIYFVSVLLFALADCDFTTSITAVGATLGNVGPGLGKVGPLANYHGFAAGLKWHMILLMIAGRLELYSLVILLLPEYWKK
ncbi:MAG: TrkH family potassium uptake protein [Proteobacteria bacterium]|nr:TrkH family potassium uptake protein [Pseudomonadota bacterium]